MTQLLSDWACPRRLVSPQVLRKGASRSSARVGDLAEGTVVVVLERMSEGGAADEEHERLRVRPEGGGDGGSGSSRLSSRLGTGWCSIRSAKDGSAILRPCSASNTSIDDW